MNPVSRGVFRAVAPFSPKPPFSLYSGEDIAPKVVKTVEEVVDAAPVIGAEFTFLNGTKVRPVFVMTEPVKPYDEVLALRLCRLSKFKPEVQKLIREGSPKVPRLCYLNPKRFSGLLEENAAMVHTMMRLPMSAIDTRQSLGWATPDELAVIHGRAIEHHGLDVRYLAVREARRMLAQKKN